MLPEVRILAGPARCGKTGQLLVEYRRALATGPLGCALWLSPTHRAAAEVRAALLDSTLGGCFQPQCLTFDQFARRVLDASSLAIRNLPVPLVRHFVNQLIRQALERDELRYFRPIAHTRGFLDLVVGAIQEFKRLEIWPEHLAEALGRRPSLKDRELCLLYQRYQQQRSITCTTRKGGSGKRGHCCAPASGSPSSV
jgi:ATP-dependent helicase/DNAse subunit B